jgi:hypothetical protein
MVKVVELRARLSSCIPRGLNSARGAAACRSARDRRKVAGLSEIARGGGKGTQGSGKRVVNKMKGETGGQSPQLLRLRCQETQRLACFRPPPLAIWKITPTFGSCFSVYLGSAVSVGQGAPPLVPGSPAPHPSSGSDVGSIFTIDENSWQTCVLIHDACYLSSMMSIRLFKIK